MNKSKCPVCGSKHTIKYGVRNGIQTYKCADCGYRFRNSKLPSDLELWQMYQENKQTVAELATSLGTSPSTIKCRLRNIVIEWEQPPLSGHGFVHLDATYWGRNDGVLAALDSQTGKILYIAFIKHERVSDYLDAVSSIEERGYRIDGIIIDGLQSLFTLFSAYKILRYWCKINKFLTVQFHIKFLLYILKYAVPWGFEIYMYDFRHIPRIVGMYLCKVLEFLNHGARIVAFACCQRSCE